MRDVFYTLLVVWFIWRVMESISGARAKVNSGPRRSQPRQPKTGETTVEYVPPKTKSKYEGKGEYVDYEEVK